MIKNIKIIVLIVIITIISFLISITDFSFIYLNFPEAKRELAQMIKEANQQVFMPVPLRFEGRGGRSFLTLKGIINATNEKRKNYGLSPLTENLNLNFSALIKNEDMCLNEYFSHDSPSGKRLVDLVEATGYDFIIIGENLAMGDFKDDEDLVSAWMDSPGHRENILGKNYKEIGVSVLKCNFEGKETWMAVQHFALPVSACFVIDETIKQKIDLNEKKIENYIKTLNKLNEDIAYLRIGRNPQYAQKAEEYGRIMGEYNILVDETEKLINKYNSQVELFNECLNSFGGQ